MNAKEIIDHIIALPPTPAFLERAEDGLDAAALADVVRAVRAVGAVPANLAAVRSALPHPVIDVCGTGGSKSSRLNTSTLVALFAPEWGVSVIKHGGRSASGKLGSLDLLERLELDIAFLYENAAECLRAAGLAYLGAGLTYAGFARYSAVRKTLGRPTIFNLLGPLLNPARPDGRLMGAYSEDKAFLLAQTLVALGEEGVVVCSEDACGVLDEASPYGVTTTHVVRDGTLRSFAIPAPKAMAAPRTEVFEDGVQAALDLLSGAETLSGLCAFDFVSYNLAFLALALAPRNDGMGVSLKDVRTDEDATRVVHAAWAHVAETFTARRACASARLRRLRGLSPLHPASPTRLGCRILEETPRTRIEDRMPRRPFARSVRGNEGASTQMDRGLLFAEVKIRTPLRTFESPLPLARRVAAYDAADAISVVTHPDFGGSLALLAQVRAQTEKPILAKDFVRRPEEVEGLAAAGADGVLLLADMVEPQVLASLVEACARSGVTPFIESSLEPPRVPLEQGFPVFNSRNLFSLEEARGYRDAVARSARMGLGSGRGIVQAPDAAQGSGCILASSLSDPLDIFLALQEAQGVIVGSALMKLHDESAIRSFLSACTRTAPLFKACGARSRVDVEMAFSEGADCVGINLIPSSKRFVGPVALEDMVRGLAQSVHGRLVFITSHETPAGCARIASDIPGLEQPYGLPLLARRRGVLATYTQNGAALGALAKVLDGARPGSGQVTSYAPNAVRLPVPVLVAGGIDAANVLARFEAGLAAEWNVVGVDVASGIDSGTGFDKQKLAQLRARLS